MLPQEGREAALRIGNSGSASGWEGGRERTSSRWRPFSDQVRQLAVRHPTQLGRTPASPASDTKLYAMACSARDEAKSDFALNYA